MGCIYRSPNANTATNDLLLQALREASNDNKYTHLLICGDFNCPSINWKDDIAPTNEETLGYKLKECIRDCYLTQHIKDHTHRRGSQQPTTIDLVLTNEEDMIDTVNFEAPLGKSHHATLVFKLKAYMSKPNKPQKKVMYNKGDYEKLRRCMEGYEWSKDLADLKCEDMWKMFCNRLTSHMKDSIPVKTLSNDKPRPSWMTQEALTKIKKKTSTYRRYLATLSNEDYTSYTRARNQAKWASRKAKKMFELRLSRETKNNPKAFYKYVNSKLKTRAGVANLVTPEGTASSDTEKAQALNTFFVSVFTQETPDIPDFQPSKKIAHPMADPIITAQEVVKKLSKLKPNKSPGPDGMHPRLLKEIGTSIAEPLSIIMNKSIEEGTVPLDWKDANVTPIYKKGKKTDPGNYRPVSLTSVVCKTMESIIRDHLLTHVKTNNLLVGCQHGFCKGRSCTTQLLYCLDVWTDLLDSGLAVDAIYLDFAKAFDSVPHQRLLRKLRGYGFTNNLLKWSSSFLVGRRQRVIINGNSSEWANVTSGVPQGSVLGPLYFVLFINDMPKTVENYIALFADDAKIFAAIRCPEDHKSLQNDLTQLQAWTEKWQLRFNAQKCKSIHFGRNNPQHQYHIGHTPLESVTEEKDLGVAIDNELKFDIHTEKQVNKANSQLGLIRRSFDTLDKETFINLYKSMVRPHLEYCHAISYPRLERQAKLLENVQRRATKLVPELKDLEYEERLRRLKLPSLRYRRERGDIIEAYKFLHDYYDVENNPLTLDDATRRTRGHSLKLKKIRCNTTMRQQFFSFRVINNWNKLPDNIVNAPSLNALKNRLDQHWKDRHYMITPQQQQTRRTQD